MKSAEKPWSDVQEGVKEEKDSEGFRKEPDPETYYGYGLAGTVIRRCRRVFSDSSGLSLRYSGREVTCEERREIIEDFIRHVKERILMFIHRDVMPADMESENQTAMSEFHRVRQNKNIIGKNALTVVFDDGSAFAYSDHGYDAYFAKTFDVASIRPVH